MSRTPPTRGALALSRPDDPRPPDVQVSDEVCDAANDLDRRGHDFFHFPWPALDAIVGGMSIGDVCYIGAFSGHGKTTFLSSLTDRVFEAMDTRIFYMGLESRPKTMRTHWACKRLGYDAGDLLSGAYLTWSNAAEVRTAVQQELLSQVAGEKATRVRFCGTPYVTVASLWSQAKLADEFGASLFIIDHVDHIGGSDHKSAWEQSVEVNRAILEIAQHYGFLMLVATQFNLEATRGRRSALHVAPQPSFVKMGNHKREVATWMLGLYKPLKLTGVDKDALKKYNATGDGYADVIEPNTMAVSLMKHRLYGHREGSRALLGVEQGRVVDLAARDVGGVLHGIRTSRPPLP